MEQVSVLGRLAKLVVNQPGFQSLLRSDNNDGFGSASANTAEEVVSSVARGEHVLLNVRVGAESHVVLGHGEEEERAVALVEAEEAVLGDGVLEHVDHSHLVLLLKELHHRLGVFSRVRARDLNGTGQTTCSEVKQEIG